jgi:hypothetical protein
MGDIQSQSYENITDFGKIRKTIVNYVVVIFGLIFILIFILLGLYYLTPNNYQIAKWEEGRFKLENTTEYIVKPDSSSLIDLNNLNSDKYLKFSEQTNLVAKNSFKSQSIIIDGELIKSKFNSEIFIINNSNIDKKITVQFYSII